MSLLSLEMFLFLLAAVWVSVVLAGGTLIALRASNSYTRESPAEGSADRRDEDDEASRRAA